MPSEIDMQHYHELESRMRSAADVWPSEDRAAGVLARVMERRRGGSPTRGRAVLAVSLVALVLLVVAAAGLGTARSADEKKTPGNSVAEHPDMSAGPAYAGRDEPGIDYDSLQGQATRFDTAEDAGRAFGVTLSVLEGAGDNEFIAAWVSKPETSPQYLLVEYSDGSVVDITYVGDEAALLADPGTRDADIAPLISVVRVNGVDAYAIGRREADPSVDENGAIRPGTGVYVGSSRISWVAGPYAVRVMGHARDVAGLLPIAEGVSLTY